MRLFVVLFSLLIGTTVFAYPGGPSSPVAQTRLAYASTNVTTAAYVQIIASLPQAVSNLQIFDSSGQTLILGVGPIGSEVPYLIVFPGGNGPIPISIPLGARVALKSLSATASSGESDINFFY